MSEGTKRHAEIPLARDQLTDARFWRGGVWVQRLRAAHVMLGMAVVDAVLVYPVVQDDLRAGRPLRTLGVALLVLLVFATISAALGAVAPLPLASPEAHAVRDGPTLRRYEAGARLHDWLADRIEKRIAALRRQARMASSRVTRAIRVGAWATVLVSLVCLGYALVPRDGPPQPLPAQLPGLRHRRRRAVGTADGPAVRRRHRPAAAVLDRR